MTPEAMVDYYNSFNEKINKVCKAVSSARFKAYNSESFYVKLNKSFYVPKRLIESDYPVGSCVSSIEIDNYTTKNHPYLNGRKFVWVEMTNGEEFSSQVFPLSYLNKSAEEIELSEFSMFASHYKWQETKNQERELQRAQEVTNYANAREEQEKATYLILKAKYEDKVDRTQENLHVHN